MEEARIALENLRSRPTGTQFFTNAIFDALYILLQPDQG